jgi:hypothetical protein
MRDETVDEEQPQQDEPEVQADEPPPEITCSGGLSLPPMSGGNGGE